ncbi:MAG TPA: ABC transporter permease [Planctomycetota bacterium]|nr:ABC transporter permease [Planctomycetota bacterium]
MIHVAWRMLVGDRTKYLSLIMGLSFAVLLITQQASIFIGLMARTYGMVTDMPAAQVWVMDPGVQYPDDLKPLKEPDLSRVRDVPGVDWAVPLFKSTGRARSIERGEFQTVMIFGLDPTSLIGLPSKLLEGKPDDLLDVDAVFVDDAGAARLNVKTGDILELNDHRARVRGIMQTERTFASLPLIYTTYSRATNYAPKERHMLTFVLCAPKPGITNEELARRIEKATGLGAFTQWEFAKRTLAYYTKNTGITINFGTTVFLGFLVGLAVAAQTFYTFTIENIRHFGALKAMGATNGILVKMVLVQALVTGCIGYGLGVGGATLFAHFAKNNKQLAFKMPPELLLVSFGLMLLLVTAASLISIRKVVRVEPAIVFRG